MRIVFLLEEHSVKSALEKTDGARATIVVLDRAIRCGRIRI